MRTRTFVALGVALSVGLAGLAVRAQDGKPPEPKGVKVKGLVSSLGGFTATVSLPVFVSGGTVELEPGGQTGRQRFRVPTYI